MSMKPLVIAFSALLLALVQSTAASAATTTRDTNTGSSPNSADFPASYNNHSSQVSYRPNTAINVGENTMFRETIPVDCGTGQRLAGIGFTFRLMKLSKGKSRGDNDTMNFWSNGQNKYEFNIGAAAKVGQPVVLSVDLGALPPIGAGPNTLTAVSTSLGNSPSMIQDIRATKRFSFAVQDDTNINYVSIDYRCEADPDFVPPTPPTPIGVDPCCPPWNRTLLENSLQYVGSGSIGSPYTLRFAPSPALIASLQAYLNYIHTTNPALTKLNIEFQLYDQGPPALPPGHNGTAVGPVSGMVLTANSTNVVFHTNYNVNTPAIYTGVSTPGTITTPSSYPMQVGRKFMMHTGMWTDQGAFFDSKLCANVDAFIQILVKAPGQKAPGAVLEMRDSRGAITRTIPLDAP